MIKGDHLHPNMSYDAPKLTKEKSIYTNVAERIESDYDNKLYIIPPDFGKAIQHGEALKVRYISKTLNKEHCL
jgi:hypothetical protein